ncbi:hypothetical protein RvY_02433 [Ramazzottius varieornatus]|uniref:Uncharacterized protein n=1 Tax=Ramazzottius varieornatus TaxID=947166 RepID=A0A1D1UQJ9_RAMVA|nr:hypothetical protein RvY_02433 [Ramazzottius varieornatus]
MDSMWKNISTKGTVYTFISHETHLVCAGMSRFLSTDSASSSSTAAPLRFRDMIRETPRRERKGKQSVLLGR